MNVIQQGIVTLIKSAVTGEKMALPEGFHLEDASKLIHAHNIGSIIYEGAMHCGVDAETPVMQQMFRYYCRAVQVNNRQMRALERVCAAFDANGIDYMPLKGSILKAFYPKPELRMMGDADVLIRLEQYEKIIPIMQELGFQDKIGAAHELVWESEALKIELHKCLFSSKTEEFRAHFGDGWSLAKQRVGTRYSMMPEDTFVYLFTHFTKHYRSAGIGCRQLIDLWVFLRKHPMLDDCYIQSEMDCLHLGAFYRNVRRTIAMWFENGDADDVSEMITEVIFSNGSWGNLQNMVLSNDVRDTQRSQRVGNGKVNYLFRLLPDTERLHRFYPVLDRMPWLLPFIWVHYMIRKCFFTKGVWRRVGRNLSVLTKENVETRRQMLEFVGLDFYH